MSTEYVNLRAQARKFQSRFFLPAGELASLITLFTSSTQTE